MLKVDGVRLSKGTSKLISFDLLPGEILWLRGRNGVGKTTLLKSLLMQEEIRSGEIRFEDLKLSPLKPANLSLIFSYCPQSSEYLEDLKVMRILELLNIPSSSKIFSSLGLIDLVSKLTSQISQGERQRLDIAIALSRKCRVSILDEPFSSQDSKWISEITKIIVEQTLEGKAFIITSHFDFMLRQEILCKEVTLS